MLGGSRGWSMTDRAKPMALIGVGLLRRAEIDGRDLDSFLAEWLRHCEALNQPLMASPWVILQMADIDRHCGNRHTADEMDIERQAYIRHRRQHEGLESV